MKKSRFFPHGHTIVQWMVQHPALLFLAWATGLSFLYFGLGPASYIRIHDNADSILAARIMLAQLIQEGTLGWWNDLIASGSDIMASAHVQWSLLLFLLLPDWLAYGMLMMIQRFVAGYFMFRLLRDSIQIDTFPALFAGLVFASTPNPSPQTFLAGFTTYDELSLPGIPLVLWMLWYSSTLQSWKAYALAAATGAIWALVSHYAFVVFFMPFLVLWFLLIYPRYQWQFWLKFAVFGGAWMLVSLPSLGTTLVFAATSHRADWSIDWTEVSTDSWRWIERTLIWSFPYLFPIIIGAMGIIAAPGRAWRLISAMFIVLSILVFYGAYPIFGRHMSVFETILASTNLRVRLLVAIPFFAAVASGLGLHYILDSGRTRDIDISPQKRVLLSRIATLSVLVLLLQQCSVQWGMVREMAQGATFANAYEHPDLEYLAHHRESEAPFRVATVHGKDVHPSFAWAYGLSTIDGYINMYPQYYEDYWAQVIHPLQERDSSNYDYYTTWGNRIYLFAPGSSHSSLPAPENDNWDMHGFFDTELLSLANVRYIISPYRLEGVHWRELPSQLSAEQVRLPEDEGNIAARLYQLISQGGAVYDRLYVYENPYALPRFFITHRVQTFEDDEALLQTLYDTPLRELASTAYVRSDDLPEHVHDSLMQTRVSITSDAGDSSQVHVVSYAADQIVLDIDTDMPGILVLSNIYNPYWTASIDGAEAEIFPVDHTFQGVYLDAGSQQVVLRYAPPWTRLPF